MRRQGCGRGVAGRRRSARGGRRGTPATCLLALGILLALVLGCGPAYADPVGPPDDLSSVSVTRLSMDGIHGALTVRVDVRSTGYTGFEIVFPDDVGWWGLPPDPVLPGTDVRCRLDYTHPHEEMRCGQTTDADAPVSLPVGVWTLTVRAVDYHAADSSGLVYLDGLAGAAGAPVHVARYQRDWFPIYAPAGPRSTAEVGVAPVSGTFVLGGHSDLTAQVVVALDVDAAERVDALDIGLGRNQWTITGSNAARLSLQCYVRSAGPTVHCKPLDAGGTLPAGRSQLVLDLAQSGGSLPPPQDILGSLDLTDAAGTTWRADSFPWLLAEQD